MDAKGCSPSQRSHPKEVRASPSWSMDIRAVSELRRMLEKPYFSKEMRRPNTWCCTNRPVCVRLPEAAKQVHTLLQKRLIWFTKLNSDINNAKKTSGKYDPSLDFTLKVVWSKVRLKWAPWICWLYLVLLLFYFIVVNKGLQQDIDDSIISLEY